MNKIIWKILEPIFWMLISVLQIVLHTVRMFENGISWNIVFVIIFSVLFGCWLTLLIDRIFNYKD